MAVNISKSSGSTPTGNSQSTGRGSARKRALTARAAAALLAASTLTALPGAAFAADIPATIRTQATLRVSSTETPGLFESRTDSDWYRVRLTAGTDYAIAGDTSGYFVFLSLRDARGRVISPPPIGGELSDAGFEFRAPRTGTYFVEVKFDEAGGGFQYNVAVAPDCREGRTTQCTLRVGVRQQRVTAWAFDVDWFRVTLTRGRNYRLDLQSSTGEGRFVSASGATLGGASGFTPGASGTYYVEVKTGEDEGEGYTVALLTP